MTTNEELAVRVIEHYKEIIGDRVFDTPLDAAKYWIANSPSTHGQWDLLGEEVKDFYVLVVTVIQRDMKAA